MAHKSRELLQQQLQRSNDVLVGGRYVHYKTKSVYIVEKLVVLEASDEVAVAYYDETHPDITWIRTYQDFVAKPDGQPRFSLLS